MNHDCRPNAAYFFDEATLTHYTHAARDIFPGDEISISYTDIVQPRAVRQHALHSEWGFKCSCSACSLGPMLARESDTRVRRILDLTDVLDDLRDEVWEERRSSGDTTGVTSRGGITAPPTPLATAAPASETGSLAAALELVGLIEMERLDPYADSSIRLAMEYAAVGDAHRAKLHARQAVDAYIIDEGFEGEGVTWARVLADNPTQHWSWRKRLERKEREDKRYGSKYRR